MFLIKYLSHLSIYLSRDHNVLVRLMIEAGFWLYQMLLAVSPPISKQHLSSANYIILCSGSSTLIRMLSNRTPVEGIP